MKSMKSKVITRAERAIAERAIMLRLPWTVTAKARFSMRKTRYLNELYHLLRSDAKDKLDHDNSE